MTDRATPEARKRANDKWKAANPGWHADYQRRKRDAAKAYIREAKARPCTDCGGQFPAVCMDFDHMPGHVKRFEVSDLRSVGASLALIAAEIAKCELVCANCHRVRTERRRAALASERLSA